VFQLLPNTFFNTIKLQGLDTDMASRPRRRPRTKAKNNILECTDFAHVTPDVP